MPPQKTQPAQVITDGDDRLTVPGLMGILRHILDELHDQNKTAAEQGLALVELDLKMARLMVLADEAAPLLESPVAKFMAQRRALKAARGADKTVVDG